MIRFVVESLNASRSQVLLCLWYYLLTFQWAVRTWGFPTTNNRRIRHGPCSGWFLELRIPACRKTSTSSYWSRSSWRNRNRPVRNDEYHYQILDTRSWTEMHYDNSVRLRKLHHLVFGFPAYSGQRSETFSHFTRSRIATKFLRGVSMRGVFIDNSRAQPTPNGVALGVNISTVTMMGARVYTGSTWTCSQLTSLIYPRVSRSRFSGLRSL